MTETQPVSPAHAAAVHRIGANGAALHRFFTRALHRALSGDGLTHLQFLAIYHIHTNDAPLSQGVLAEHLAIEGQTFVRMLDAMEKQGWVRRVPDAVDRRVKRIALAAPPARLEHVFNKFRELQLAAFADFTAEELETFSRLQGKLTTGLNRLGGEADDALLETL